MTHISATDKYDVAIILINYNSSSFTLKCISSIFQQTDTDLSYGIVIVDNASESKDYSRLVDGLSQFHDKIPVYLFSSKINTGFATGNMLGVQFISAKYYFFLNNDCRLQNDCLNILYKFCEKTPQAALCSPQLYNDNATHQPCFDYFPYLITKIFGLGILKPSYGKRFIKRKGIYNNPVQVDIVSGSQMFVRSDVFNEIGGFDTTFFLYCEEEDIAIRVFQKGYKTFLVPDAKNIHTGGGSTTSSLEIKKEFYISFLYFYRKHYGFLKTNALKILIVLRMLKKLLKSKDHIKIAIFVLAGAHFKHSLKHRQKIIQR